MLQIRRNVFETNSSSTHSITICAADEYQKWADGEMLLVVDSCLTDKPFVTVDEAKDIVREYELEHAYKWGSPLDDYYHKNDIENGVRYTHIEDVPDNLVTPYLECYSMYTHDGYCYEYCDWYETYLERYTTEHGDDIVCFGYYGMD